MGRGLDSRHRRDESRGGTARWQMDPGRERSADEDMVADGRKRRARSRRGRKPGAARRGEPGHGDAQGLCWRCNGTLYLDGARQGREIYRRQGHRSAGEHSGGRKGLGSACKDDRRNPKGRPGGDGVAWQDFHRARRPERRQGDRMAEFKREVRVDPGHDGQEPHPGVRRPGSGTVGRGSGRT